MEEEEHLEDLEHLFSSIGSFRKLRKGKRVVRGYFEIHHGFIEFEAEHEPRRVRPLKGSHITTFSRPRYNFPRRDKEKKGLCETVTELQSNFKDTVTRQIIFFKLKSLVSQLRETVGMESRAFLRVLNMCSDALQNIRAEQLKTEQVKALKFVFENMDENMDDFLANELEGILIDSGLEPTPSIEGIASLY